eukprot:14221115-Alexandrium_andersonii.AAC.1
MGPNASSNPPGPWRAQPRSCLPPDRPCHERHVGSQGGLGDDDAGDGERAHQLRPGPAPGVDAGRVEGAGEVGARSEGDV